MTDEDSLTSSQYTCIYFASSNPLELEKAINDDLNAIHEWLLHNKLILNVKKCQFMSVGSKRNRKKFENVSIKIKMSLYKELIITSI